MRYRKEPQTLLFWDKNGRFFFNRELCRTRRLKHENHDFAVTEFCATLSTLRRPSHQSRAVSRVHLTGTSRRCLDSVISTGTSGGGKSSKELSKELRAGCTRGVAPGVIWGVCDFAEDDGGVASQKVK